ncbi:MAG TPA: hypothetical protein GX509_08025 [Firmicutes bacterium]|nr:hypothetical protein [Bacillota bacterium]
MIDIHTHILPGIDDGADSIETSTLMAHDAVSGGTEVVVATPHILPGGALIGPDMIQSHVRDLGREISRKGIHLKLLPGAEIAIDIDLLSRLKSGEYCTIGGASRYVLIELPFQDIPIYSQHVIFSLASSGYVPIIAHPERNARIMSDPGSFYEFFQSGALGQVSAGSITGEFGPHARRAAEFLIESRLVQIIASDGHNARTRRCRLDRAWAVAARLVGRELAREMVEGIPRAVIENSEVDRGEVRLHRHRRLFSFGWGRG